MCHLLSLDFLSTRLHPPYQIIAHKAQRLNLFKFIYCGNSACLILPMHKIDLVTGLLDLVNLFAHFLGIFDHHTAADLHRIEVCFQSSRQHGQCVRDLWQVTHDLMETLTVLDRQ